MAINIELLQLSIKLCTIIRPWIYFTQLSLLPLKAKIRLIVHDQHIFRIIYVDSAHIKNPSFPDVLIKRDRVTDRVIQSIHDGGNICRPGGNQSNHRVSERLS